MKKMNKIQKAFLYGAIFGIVFFLLGVFTGKLSSAIFYGVVLGVLFGISVFLHYLNKENRAALKDARSKASDGDSHKD